LSACQAVVFQQPPRILLLSLTLSQYIAGKSALQHLYTNISIYVVQFFQHQRESSYIIYMVNDASLYYLHVKLYYSSCVAYSITMRPHIHLPSADI
jgi:hypothetical protein